jgi:protein-disulfide isomerase
MQNKLFYIVVLLLIGGFIAWVQLSGGSKEETVQSIQVTQFSKGDPNASVVVRQYSDFLCPSCSQVSLSVIPEVMKQYVDTNKVFYEFIPMAFIAPGSQLAAEGAFCAAKQNKFWEYHDAAYAAVWNGYFSKGVDPRQVQLYSKDGVKKLGATVGVDETAFSSCIDTNDQQDEVIALTKESQANGITGTPYFTVNDTPIKGIPDFQILDAAIKAQL